MTEVTAPTPPEAPAEIDLVTALHRVLQNSPEPLTLTKIRPLLPASFRPIGLEELVDSLRRQVAANVVWQYPKYRSQQDRYWDRPMPVHVAALLRAVLQEGPLPWSVLRRKMPAYAQPQLEPVLKEHLSQGLLFCHPRIGRSGERFGLNPPNPKEYLRPELGNLFRRLEQLGFNQSQLRANALELLHEEEWAGIPEVPGRAASPTPVTEQLESPLESIPAGSPLPQ